MMTELTTEQKTGLDQLRKPVPEHLISRFPINAGAKANLEYCGHAATTAILLDADPNWTYEFVSGSGLPEFDEHGGLWIKLTVCGVTRMGYGFATGMKGKGGDDIKECIGDAIRNAAMRFGVGLDLWHKGDLHIQPVELASQQEVDLINTMIQLRRDAREKGVEFKEGAFSGWMKSIKIDSIETMSAQAVETVYNALNRAEWPEDFVVPTLGDIA